MRSGRNFGSFDSQYSQYSIPSILYPFLSFSVHNFSTRTDGQTFFEKVLSFPPDKEYTYISIPISIIFQISPPMTYYWPKLVYLFFSILEIGMKIQMINSPQVWENWAVLHKLHLTKLINLNILNTFIKKLMKTSKN